MKGGRSGMRSAAKNRQDKYKQQTSDIENQVIIQEVKPLMIQHGTLRLYKTPVAVWGAGVFAILCGLYLIYHLIWGFEGKWLTNFSQGYWWQYFVACIIILIGIGFVFAVKMEQVDFNKAQDSIKVDTKNICCFHNLFQRKLTQLFNVSILKRGSDTIQNKTLHYKLLLNFDDGTHLEIMETNSLKSIKRKYVQIKIFLGQQSELKEINIVDESTR